jgi:hypothetical protein
MNNPTLFFQSSQNITARLGEIFDFLWPAMAGLWNLRWQVSGFASVTNKREAKELYAKFVEGSGVTQANLKVSCLEKSWESQREQFAKFLLVELCALYEGWIEDVTPRVVPPSEIQRFQKDLQFPTSTGPNISGLSRAITKVNNSPSILLKTEFFPALKANVKNSWAHREELLRAYRYFKEMRNTLMHGGGLATATAVSAYSAFVNIPISSLYFKKAPSAPPVVLDLPVRLELSDVVGLGNIIHRLIVTLDAALAVSTHAENDLLIRLQRSYAMSKARGKHKILSTVDPSRRAQQIASMLSAAGLPNPAKTYRLDALIIAKGLAF